MIVDEPGFYKVRWGAMIEVTTLNADNEFYPVQGHMVDGPHHTKVGMTLKYTRLGNYWHSKIKSKWDIMEKLL